MSEACRGVEGTRVASRHRWGRLWGVSTKSWMSWAQRSRQQPGPDAAGMDRIARAMRGRKPQKSRIGSMRSAKINTTPEIRITPPTT